jgi:hypothetical protein
MDNNCKGDLLGAFATLQLTPTVCNRYLEGSYRIAFPNTLCMRGTIWLKINLGFTATSCQTWRVFLGKCNNACWAVLNKKIAAAEQSSPSHLSP